MRVLGIDPGYAIVGWGVVDYVGNRFAPVDFGAVCTDAGVPFERRLDEVYTGVREVIERTQPEVLAIEKLFLLPHLKKGKVWPHIYTLFLVVVGWAMFVGNDTGVSFGLLFQKLFIPSGGVSPLYFLRNYGVLLIVSVICCTPLIEKIWNTLRRNVITRCATILLLLVVSTAYVVGSTNSPFLYFNF